MPKIKLVVSDFHVGRGRLMPDGGINLLEEFIFDSRFMDFLDYYSHDEFRRAEVELILNGDFMNTIMVDFDEEYPRILTEAANVEKVRKILDGHAEMFDALSGFAQAPNHSVVYIAGNHDPAIHWPAVRRLLQDRLGSEILFPGFSYSFDGVWVEHGHQHVAANRFDQDHLIIRAKELEEPILNLPWGCFFVIDYLNPIKRKRSYVDRVQPFSRYLLSAYLLDTGFALSASFRLLSFVLSHQFEKHKWHSTPLRNTLDMIRQISIIPDLEKNGREILKSGSYHTVIMGHNHQPSYRKVGRNKLYVNVGTWNDIIHLDLENLGRQRRTTYGYIEYEKGGRISTHLKLWKGRHMVEEDMIF
jgi:UDP-2,3-diacylglucosamine pyrophosphatase LpxH